VQINCSKYHDIIVHYRFVIQNKKIQFQPLLGELTLNYTIVVASYFSVTVWEILPYIDESTVHHRFLSGMSGKSHETFRAPHEHAGYRSTPVQTGTQQCFFQQSLLLFSM
jgi:hypothetical protein